MSVLFIAEVPVEFQQDGVVQLLMEVMGASDVDQGVFLFYLLADGKGNGFDDYFPDRDSLEAMAWKNFGIEPFNWKRFTGRRPDLRGLTNS